MQRQRFDVLWLEYEAFPWLPAWLEALVLAGNTPYLVDYDDAIFHRYDQHSNQWVRRWLGNKIDKGNTEQVETAVNDFSAIESDEETEPQGTSR